MTRSRRPEVGRLPRAQFGVKTPTKTPAAVQEIVGPAHSATPMELLAKLIEDRSFAIEEVGVEVQARIDHVRKVGKELLDQFESEKKELMALQKIFKAANLLVHDENSMYDFVANQLGTVNRDSIAAAFDIDAGGESD